MKPIRRPVPSSASVRRNTFAGDWSTASGLRTGMSIGVSESVTTMAMNSRTCIGT